MALGAKPARQRVQSGPQLEFAKYENHIEDCNLSITIAVIPSRLIFLSKG